MGIYGRETPSLGIRGEQALWRAVITQALMDAASQSAKMELKYQKSQALCWLTTYGDDFRTVCENAGFNPQYIREQSLKALERNCQWRAVPGKKLKEISRTSDKERVE